ncbi:MAG: hypothetical protein EKK40_14945 [Bradyrhizobiaceae bacterium]|nr:MAG: hypothetical protein EKK40_14945 [Bradyrhizobiaceae bacterium]
MGIDRHELEHRNWRSKAPGREAGSREADAEPDVTIVPDDVAALAPKPPRKPRKSATKVKANA